MRDWELTKEQEQFNLDQTESAYSAGRELIKGIAEPDFNPEDFEVRLKIVTKHEKIVIKSISSSGYWSDWGASGPGGGQYIGPSTSYYSKKTDAHLKVADLTPVPDVVNDILKELVVRYSFEGYQQLKSTLNNEDPESFQAFDEFVKARNLTYTD